MSGGPEHPMDPAEPRPRVLAVGLSCLDHIWSVERFPPVSSRTPAGAYRRQGGGPAATAAYACARLGADVDLWAVHGDDDGGRAVAAELAAAGVGVAALRVVPGAITFTSAVLVAPGGERWIFPYRGRELDDDPAPFPLGGVPGYGAVVTDLRHPRLCGAALRAARAAGVPTVGDVSNLRDRELWGDLDHLLASREAAAELIGRDDPAAALQALRSRPDQVVGVTLGAEGVLLSDGAGTAHVPAPAVEAVDTTGAGDVFHGAWARAVAAGEAPRAAARYAAAAAAVSVTGVGRSAVPTHDQVTRLLEPCAPHEADAVRRT